MALNIPMPKLPFEGLDESIGRGGNLFSQIMHPVISRENMVRQWQEHLDDMKLRQQAMAHAARNEDLQRQIMQQTLLKAQHDNDPMYKFNVLKQLMSGGNPASLSMPSQEIGQGLGVFTPEGLAQEQQALSAPKTAPKTAPTGNTGNNELMNNLMKNPIMRGWFKDEFGYDPLAPTAQTPEDKQAMALDLFKQKEEIKKQSKGGDVPTNAVLTQNQQAIQGIDTVLPMLDELITSKDIPGIMNISPGAKAAYNAKTSSMIDTLVAAQSLPKVQASIDLVEEQIRRKMGETVHDYQKRLKDLKKDLIKRRARSKDVLSNRRVNTEGGDDFAGMSDEELQRIAGGG